MTDAEGKARDRIPAHNALKDQLVSISAERPAIAAGVDEAKAALDAAQAAYDAATWAHHQWQLRESSAASEVNRSELFLHNSGITGPF